MATIYVFDMDLLMRLHDSTETRLHALKNFLPHRVEQVKKFRKSRSKRLKKRINSVSLQPKSFLIEVKQRIVCTRVYTQFDGLSKTNKFLVLTVVYWLVIIVMLKYPLPLPPLNRFLKRKIRKAQRTNLSTHIMAYIPIDPAKRTKGLYLLAGVNMIGLGLEMVVDRIYDYDYSFIIKQILRGTRVGVSSFIVLNYEILSKIVPDELREAVEPVIVKMANPMLSLPVSIAMGSPFWIDAFNNIAYVEKTKDFLEERLRDCQLEVLSVEGREKLLELTLIDRDEKIEEHKVAADFIKKMMKALQEQVGSTEQKNFLLEQENVNLGEQYDLSRHLLEQQLARPEANCILNILDYLKKGNPLRGVKDFNSSVFSSPENKFIVEAPINEIFVKSCQSIYDRYQTPVVGGAIYQKNVFEKLVQIHNYFGGHTVDEVFEGLPIDPMLVGAQAVNQSIKKAINIVKIPKDVAEMLDQELWDKLNI